MQTAKLFANGSSQAVRLPKEFRFPGTEVLAQKLGDAVILVPREKAFGAFLASLDGFTEDYFAAMETRANEPPAEREPL